MRWLLVLALVAAVVACGKHPAEAPPAQLDRAAVYPLIVPAQDVPTGPVRRPLVDGLVIVLAEDQHGQAKVLREPDLQGWPLDDAYTAALANLDRAAHGIPVKAEVGADGHTVDVVWGHDWRAAACLLLPGVRQMAAQKLGTDRVYAAIPNRDVLVLFADRSLIEDVLAAESHAPHPISDRVLRADSPALGWAP